jgi:hypothetical protein
VGKQGLFRARKRAAYFHQRKLSVSNSLEYEKNEWPKCAGVAGRSGCFRLQCAPWSLLHGTDVVVSDNTKHGCIHSIADYRTDSDYGESLAG